MGSSLGTAIDALAGASVPAGSDAALGAELVELQAAIGRLEGEW